MVEKFNASFTIHSYQADSSQNAKISALFGFFMETAGWHATQLGVGYHKLKADINGFWALSRFSIKFNQLPKWEETINIETWPVGYNRLFAQRHFRFLNQKQELLIEGNTDWVVMRFDTRTMINPQLIVGHLNLGYNMPKVTIETVKLPLIVSDQATVHQHKVVYSDLDMNGHVNSLKYLDWCFDCLPAETILNNRLQQIDINFQHEIPSNQNVDIFLSTVDSKSFLFNGILKDADKQSFTVRIQFQ